jgi:hypothetical protein
MHHRRQEDETRNRTRIEVSGGSRPKPQCKSATRDERSSGSHAAPGGQKGFTECVTGHAGIGRRPQRVEDCLIADHAPASACEPPRSGIEHASNHPPVHRGVAACSQAGFYQRSPIQWPGRAADCSREAVPNGSQQFARAGLGRICSQQIADRLKADCHVVAVIAITKDGIQARQVLTVALDACRTTLQICSNISAADVWWWGSPRLPNEPMLRTG